MIGIELRNPEDFDGLVQRMKERNIIYEYLNDSPDLFRFLV
jgi:threonine dehydratase